MVHKQKRPSIAIIGAGRVGTTLAILLKEKGYPIAGIAGRNLDKTREAAAQIGEVKVCASEEAAKSADIVFLAVSDDSIETVCTELSQLGAFRSKQIIVHLSGALSSEKLATARSTSGALIASAHPLQTFSTTQSALAAMAGSFWFCEGDSEALSAIFPLIESIGGKPNTIPTEKKVLYHAASVAACNYLVTLMDIALTIAESADLDRELAWQALSPLVQATLRNIDQSGVTTALTGPIARGDVNTIKRHLQALETLSENKDDLTEIYKNLGHWTTKIAAEKGLPPDLVDELRKQLEH